MSKKEKKKLRTFKRIDDIFNDFIKEKKPEVRIDPPDGKVGPPVVIREAKDPNKKPVDPMKEECKEPLTESKRKMVKKEPKAPTTDEIKKKEPEKPSKTESLNMVKKRVMAIVKTHTDKNPPQTRIVTPKDIRKWILENPSLNVNSPEFLAWCRNPDSDGVSSYVKHFGELLVELKIPHTCDAEVRGYVYDFFIEPMNLYIDIDPASLETDDPKAKISITVNKNKLDVLDIWRKINESRATRCKPYRFMSIKERLYTQGVKEFIQEYLDWYYQNMINNEKTVEVTYF